MRESVIGVFLFLLSADFLRREPELVFFFAITNEFFPNNITPIVVQTYVCVLGFSRCRAFFGAPRLITRSRSPGTEKGTRGAIL